MGSSFSRGVKNFATGTLPKIAKGAGIVGKGLLSTAEHALEGGALGSPAGPGGMLAGAIGGGLTGALSNIDPVISGLKGLDSSTPVKPEDILNVTHRAGNLLGKAGDLANSPAMKQAFNNAAVGKVSKGLVQAGQFTNDVSSAVNQVLNRGGIMPSQFEKMASPTMNLAQTMLSKGQLRDLEHSRNNAFLANRISPVGGGEVPA